MLVISDASVVSALAEIGLIKLLPQLFHEVVITEQVRAECLHEEAPAEARSLMENPPEWLQLYEGMIEWQAATEPLDPGEAASISLAMSHSSETILLIDERRGRSVAEGLGLKITGTIGFLGAADEKGLVDFEEAISRLRNTKFRFSDSVVQTVRRSFQERQ